MKTTRIIFAVVILTLVTLPLKTNPIAVFFFNELKFDGSSWVIEMYSSDPLSPNVLTIRSNAGMAYFRETFRLPAGYSLITPDSLQTPLEINAQGDSLIIGAGMQSLTFGSSTSSVVASPRPGQSICFGGRGYYYLDNSPTLGTHNDSANAMGMIHGTVTDSLGVPLANVEVASMGWTTSVYTNTLGVFDVRDYARRCPMSLTRQDLHTRAETVQIWPESTVSVSIVMSPVVSVEGSRGHGAQFVLEQNYPNPFNPVTTFSFFVPRVSFVTLVVYDIHGSEVATVVKGIREPGDQKASWDGAGVASGIYFYRLVAGNFVQTRKMVLAK